MPKKAKTPFAHHALERACERYGIRLTRKQQLVFGRMLANPKHTIPLTRNRLACYFEGRWYLLACNAPPPMPTCNERPHKRPLRTMPRYTVQTFLQLEDANDDDKQILRHNERYIKTNNDAFHVLSMPLKLVEPLPPRSKRAVELPDDLTDDELPSDEIQSAERVLNTLCDEVR